MRSGGPAVSHSAAPRPGAEDEAAGVLDAFLTRQLIPAALDADHAGREVYVLPSAHPCARIDRGSHCAGHAARGGCTRAWRKVRASILTAHPVCAECGRPAAHVDHIQPIAHGGLRALCAACDLPKPIAEPIGFRACLIGVVQLCRLGASVRCLSRPGR